MNLPNAAPERIGINLCDEYHYRPQDGTIRFSPTGDIAGCISEQDRDNFKAAMNRSTPSTTAKEVANGDEVRLREKGAFQLKHNAEWPPKRFHNAKEAVFWYLDWIAKHYHPENMRRRGVGRHDISLAEVSLTYGDEYSVLERLIDDAMHYANQTSTPPAPDYAEVLEIVTSCLTYITDIKGGTWALDAIHKQANIALAAIKEREV
jgi:hypothetical protein